MAGKIADFSAIRTVNRRYDTNTLAFIAFSIIGWVLDKHFKTGDRKILR
jgi:hypothetical protein